LAAALAGAGGHRFGGFRNVASAPQAKRYRSEPGGAEHEVHYRHTRDGLAADGVRVVHAAPDRVVLEIGGVQRKFRVATYDGGRVHVNGVALTALPRFTDPSEQRAPGSLLAPMPGTVVRVAEGLAEGAPVTAGQPLIWLEAMKMEHRITAPASGTLTALHAAVGRQVEVGALLAVVQEVQK
ncbi:acety-l/propionyl-CoA carboxylase subunit alpha, partial [Streptomyces sp. SID14478]|uniref:acetyl-CoA carboxylase biotin carboxyl carrier protein subunit n=1 Tax=Streptomyces sp. SID14478 TaxID=2706073 RepID=UPI0014113179|nr:acety-l/propionyl-CoA carboxylase subunit alpha [Streptomyces sp. SID14478]